MDTKDFVDKLRVVIDTTPRLSAAGLATSAGLDNSTIRGWFRGKSSPTLQSAMRVCAAMGTTLEEFMGLEVDPARQEILSVYVELSDEERRLLLAAARGLRESHSADNH